MAAGFSAAGAFSVSVFLASGFVASVFFTSVFLTSVFFASVFLAVVFFGAAFFSAFLVSAVFSVSGFMLSETNAGEILQETFIKIWNNREKIDPDKLFSTYLYQIARNNVCDFFRKIARDKRLESVLLKNISDPYFQVEEFLNHKEDVQLLHKVLDFLPPKRREVFKLVKLEERSYTEVSEILEVSVSTINGHIVKATKFLHDRFAANRISVILAMVFLSCT